MSPSAITCPGPPRTSISPDPAWPGRGLPRSRRSAPACSRPVFDGPGDGVGPGTCPAATHAARIADASASRRRTRPVRRLPPSAASYPPCRPTRAHRPQDRLGCREAAQARLQASLGVVNLFVPCDHCRCPPNCLLDPSAIAVCDGDLVMAHRNMASGSPAFGRTSRRSEFTLPPWSDPPRRSSRLAMIDHPSGHQEVPRIALALRLVRLDNTGRGCLVHPGVDRWCPGRYRARVL